MTNLIAASRGYACAAERARGRLWQPADHADGDAIALGDRRQCFTGCTALDSLGALIVAQLTFAAELYTLGHRALAALTGAFTDQIAAKSVERSRPWLLAGIMQRFELRAACSAVSR